MEKIIHSAILNFDNIFSSSVKDEVDEEKGKKVKTLIQSLKKDYDIFSEEYMIAQIAIICCNLNMLRKDEIITKDFINKIAQSIYDHIRYVSIEDLKQNPIFDELLNINL